MSPTLSVVIPTFNRRQQLMSTLTSLAGQTLTRSEFEVIVVADGCTDDTVATLRSSAPMKIRVVEQANAGPAAARNAGIEAAHGRIVVFIDDDVVAAPDLLMRHLENHGDADDRVVIGTMLTAPDHRYAPWVAWEQAMLEKQYRSMQEHRWEVTHRQFYTGNASVARQLLERTGGFDVSYKRAEDVELGMRLDAAGATIVFDPDAIGLHYAERSFASWRSIADAYGRCDVEFARRHEGNSGLWRVRSEFGTRNVLTQLLALVTMGRPRTTNLVVKMLSADVRLASRLGDRVMFALLSAIYNTTYYHAAAEQLGSGRAFRRLLVRGPGSTPPVRAGIVLEQTLGHVTHAKNLRRLLVRDGDFDPIFGDVPFETSGPWANIPVWSNWTVRAGVRARRVIRRMIRRERAHVLFVHTQVPATLAVGFLRRTPTVVSIDATPRQYDALGSTYGHVPAGERVEGWKHRLHLRCFHAATHIVSWSEWGRRGLVEEYGIDASKVSVIPPGVDLTMWDVPRPEPDDRRVRVLFVGGDLERKGGHLLIDAVRVLHKEFRENGSGIELTADLVTRTPVLSDDVIRVHSDLGPNSPELIRLYGSADIFCLPTLGDCLPMVLSEAGAARLPIISTDVGAIRELVRDGETGIVVPIDDMAALVSALRQLAVDPALRRRLGEAAHRHVAQRYDAAVNARSLRDLLVRHAAREAPAT